MTTKPTEAQAGSAAKALFLLLLIGLGCRRQESPSARLLALAPRSGRPIEARLTGFDWQAVRLQRAPSSGLLDPARLELAGAASTLIQSLTNDLSPRARHESGAAYLLIERDRDAIDALESAVRQSPNDAAYRSDLAAARYTLAVSEKRPHELPQALADADHALRINPALPDALFNRALIIESLGITEAARRAWQRYVAADPSTHWSAEAMSHLGRLRVVTTRDEFQQKLALASRALRTGNRDPIGALARNYPQEARTWSEGPLLANWADAVLAGKTKAAEETLSVVRELGAALTEFNHVDSVADIVATIDRAGTDRTRLMTLAEAHAVYRDGRVLYNDRHVSEAEKRLRRAAGLFAPTESPMSVITDYYLANCLYDSNEPVKAGQALDQLLTRFDRKRYPALEAEVLWERSLCHVSAGEWDAAIRTGMESRNTFNTLGEATNRSQVDALVADHFDHTSQPAAAWKARVAAFSTLSAAGATDRIRNALIGGINAEAAHGNYEAALSLTAIALDDLRHARQANSLAAVEALRAEMLAKTMSLPAARQTLAHARHAAAGIVDLGLQRRTSAIIDIADAAIERNQNPARSLALVDTAIEFLKSGHGNAWLPKAYLERGRTRVHLHEDAAALADFEAGIHEIDIQRSSIGESAKRATFYDVAPELFTESVSLLLRRGDTDQAFAVADAARARSVQDQFSTHSRPANETTPEQLRQSLPEKTVLLEYELLPDSIAIFHFSAKGSGMVRVVSDVGALRALIERSGELLQQRGDVAEIQRQTAALRRLLIAPVSGALAGAKSVIIVPDRQLNAIPFAALYDTATRRYLVDDFTLSVAPSASFVVHQTAMKTLTPVLVIGDPHGSDAPPLPEAGHEAAAIAAMYDASTLLTDEKATRARFIALAQRSAIIHYAGHARSDATESFGALRLAADRPNATGDLDASDIATLHLSKSPLVVLAGCGTMRGDAEHVEGMPSIARAFLSAGARSVIGTLWEVDDDTIAPLFRRLHQELRSGAGASDALRTAQVALAHDSDIRLRHPASWAPVELIGYTNETATPRAKRSK